MFCRKCGRENPGKNKFCNGCGVAFVVTPSPSPQIAVVAPPPPPPKVIEEKQREIEPLKVIEAEVIEYKNGAESLAVRGIEIEKKPEFAAPPENIKVSDESEEHEDLSKVFEETELLLDELFKDEKSEPSKEVVISESTPKVLETTQSNEMPTAEFSTESLLESINKSKFPEKTSKPKNKKPLIIGAIAAVVLITAIFGLAALFMSGNRNAEKVSENKTTVAETNEQIVEKPNPNAPPDGMAYISGGVFMMGNDEGDSFSSPAHEVSIKPFFVDITEVTCEDYKKFVDAENYKPPPTWKNNNFSDDAARKPVTGVTWDDANAYAKWKGKRLPTEEEWEFAARGTDGRIYPWGNTWNSEFANANNQHREVHEVGELSAKSPFGLYDMVGNAWEWTSSDANAYPNGNEFPPKPDTKIIRGGYFGSSKEKATTTFRGAWGATGEKDYGNTGFRCASDVSANQK